ncbi:unnamed protein product, partial [Heterotrigona itama]
YRDIEFNILHIKDVINLLSLATNFIVILATNFIVVAVY